MTKEKTENARLMDAIQAALRPWFRDRGFRVRGGTFNRATADGLTHVLSLQMGAFDPPGTVELPGFRENLYGRFTVNLGVYIPEVAKYHGAGGKVPSFVHEYHCSLRARIGYLGPEQHDLWWSLSAGPGVSAELLLRIERDVLPWFARYDSRDSVLAALLEVPRSTYTNTPRIVCALILAERGSGEQARALLAAQAREVTGHGHPAYVRSLSEKVGLGPLPD